MGELQSVLQMYTVPMKFDSQGTIEEKATLDFEAGVGVDILVEYINTSPPRSGDEEDDMRSSQPALMRGVVGPKFEVTVRR